MKSVKDVKTDVDAWWIGARCKMKQKFNSAKEWCEENKDLAIAMIPAGIIVIKGIGKTIRSIDRKMDLKKEQEFQDMYVYDHSLGMYLKLRRPLRPSEKIELDRRRKDGETKIQILASMGLLD